MGEWMQFNNFPFQLTVDNRNPLQKVMVREFDDDKTFKTNVNVWSDKPRIIASEQVKLHSESNSSSIHMLDDLDKIVHIVSTKDPKQVSFIFYEGKPPLKKKK